MGSTLDNLGALVAFQTVSRSSNLELVDWCADRATRFGGDATVLPGGTSQANLLLRFGPQAPGGVLLAGHSDVVAAGDGWTTDPFRLTRRGDSVVGRGSADMKGFIAASLSLVESIDVTTLRAPVHVAISFDEEIGCKGVHGILDHLRGAPATPELVIVGEPTSMRVCTAHAGKVAYTVQITAAAGHSSRSRVLPSAVLAAAELAMGVDNLQRQGPPADNTLLSTNVGRIEGGVGLNVIAPHAELSFEVRHDASLDVDELLMTIWRTAERIRRRLASTGGSLEVTETIRYPGLVDRAPGESVWKLVAASGSPRLSAIDFGCEAGLYATVIDAPIVICGPGDIADAHRADEFVTLEQLDRCDSALAEVVAGLCASR